MHDDEKGGSETPQARPGNIPQLPKVGWTNNDLRLEWAEWCHAEMASWSSVHFVTLNFRPSVLANAGASATARSAASASGGQEVRESGGSLGLWKSSSTGQ